MGTLEKWDPIKRVGMVLKTMQQDFPAKWSGNCGPFHKTRDVFWERVQQKSVGDKVEESRNQMRLGWTSWSSKNNPGVRIELCQNRAVLQLGWVPLGWFATESSFCSQLDSYVIMVSHSFEVAIAHVFPKITFSSERQIIKTTLIFSPNERWTEKFYQIPFSRFQECENGANPANKVGQFFGECLEAWDSWQPAIKTLTLGK